MGGVDEVDPFANAVLPCCNDVGLFLGLPVPGRSVAPGPGTDAQLRSVDISVFAFVCDLFVGGWDSVFWHDGCETVKGRVDWVGLGVLAAVDASDG